MRRARERSMPGETAGAAAARARLAKVAEFTAFIDSRLKARLAASAAGGENALSRPAGGLGPRDGGARRDAG